MITRSFIQFPFAIFFLNYKFKKLTASQFWSYGLQNHFLYWFFFDIVI